MIAPSLHPGPIRAACERRRRWAFGLTPRAIGLLLVGFLSLIPGFWIGRLAYSMLAWDALVLLAALLDGLRLPSAVQLTAGRTWSNAPALDSQTEIELTIENGGRTIIDCRIIDDLPPALTAPDAPPVTHRLTAFPRVPARLRYHVEPQERGDCETGWLYIRYRSPLGLAECWAKAPLIQKVRVYPALRTGEEQQIFLARSRQIDLQLRQARQRGLGRDFESLREYREGDDLRDICWTATARRGDSNHPPVPDRTQPGRLDRPRLRPPDALPCRTILNRHTRPKLRGDASAATPSSTSPAPPPSPSPSSRSYSGDRVGLLAYGQNIQQRLLPGRGAAHLRQLIESLAQVQRRIQRSRPPPRHRHPQSPPAPPLPDSLGHRPGRDRHAP